MSLMSKWWVLAAAVLTLLLIITAVMLMRRRHWAVRAGSALITMLAATTALSGIALTSNLQMGFIPDTDALVALMLNDTAANATPLPRPTASIPDNGTLGEDTAPSDEPQWQLHTTPDSDNPHIHRVDWSGPDSKVSSVVAVWLPPDYSPDDGKTYSVVEFMHGIPGSWVGVIEALDWENTYDKLLSQGMIKPTIFVIPDLLAGQGEPDCLDFPNRPHVETWVTHDVPKAVRSTFPNVSNDRKDWALVGISSGAYCTANLTMRHPQMYGAGIAMSGYDRPMLGSLANADASTQQHNVISQMISALEHPAALYLTATQTDQDAMALVKNAKARQNKELLLQTLIQAEGGHSWKTWAQQLPAALTWWRSDEVQNWIVKVESGDHTTVTPSVAASPSPSTAQDGTATTAQADDGDEPAGSTTDTAEASAPIFGLIGWGTLAVAWTIALAAWGTVAMCFPAAGKRTDGQRYRPLRTWIHLPLATVTTTTVIGLLVMAAMLTINYEDQFFTSLPDLITGLPTMFP